MSLSLHYYSASVARVWRYINLIITITIITEWGMYITAQGCRLRNDLYCVDSRVGR